MFTLNQVSINKCPHKALLISPESDHGHRPASWTHLSGAECSLEAHGEAKPQLQVHSNQKDDSDTCFAISFNTNTAGDPGSIEY